ncbi:TrkH family potassium uptake protein [Persicobacter sp. CCB-QB2]|uniref:TrkH family potassium uptake protein n=1 Tax=Persicobacter sp. CCB-QB2 TaxID=1561025 RepID=UPI00092F87AB|nr:potassium transporter TrkG [Persicobacter sp. CCB-QB2]
MSRNPIFERIINQLYLSRPIAYKIIGISRFLITLAVVLGIVYAIGFELDQIQLQKVTFWLDIALDFYIINFIARGIYSLRMKEFLLSHKFEFALILFVLLNKATTHHLDNYIFELLLKSKFIHTRHSNFYFFFVSLCLLFIFINEFAVASRFLSNLTIKPAKLITLSFLSLILAGAGTLMLPAMTTSGGSMPFIDAIFTSTSAVCVTGLIVVDTATYFTTKGQFVIMLLFQLGGLGIIAFAVFFSGILGGQSNIKEQMLIQDYLSSDSLKDSIETLKVIFKMTFLIEAAAAVGIYMTWGSGVQFESQLQKIFFSVFHAISAFCNAGFSLYTNNLYEAGVRDAYLLHVIVAATIICGGIGFGAMKDLFSIKRLRERLEKPWMEWKLGTRISIWVSFFLIIFGTLCFWLLEKNNVMSGMNTGQSIISAMFQSVSTRTAGFNTVDLSRIKTSTVLIMSFLMFIGASSGSTGGGIKTSTFFVILSSMYANIRGKSRIEIGKRELPKEALFNANAIFVFAILINAVSIILLTIFQEKSPLQVIIFEQISAFSTCGLSMGLTSSLDYWSKWIIINSMFLGRVGSLTFIVAISSSKYSKIYKYPSANIMVG